MKRVATAVVLIPLVILALFKAPLWLFTLLVLGVALLAAREYLDIAVASGFRPFRTWCYLFVICAFELVWGANAVAGPNVPVVLASAASFVTGTAGLALLASPFVLLIAGLRREPLSQCLPDVSVSAFALPYVALTLVCLPILRSYRNGALYLLCVMLLVWVGDVAAYYVGRTIGRHKLAPRVSPGKSWEGAVASVVAAVMLAMVLFRYVGPIWNALHRIHLTSWHSVVAQEMPAFAPAQWWMAGLFAVCINVAAQLGDLVESALKRGAGVKESGTLLPGHGGVLDRIDALLFAVPVGWLFYVAGYSEYFIPRWGGIR